MPAATTAAAAVPARPTWAPRLFHPVTRQRWARFRRLKRAYWSLWLLTGFTVLSLFAELLCNDQPLYLRFGGRSYFPLLRFQPEDAFLHNGNLNRPNYKRLRQTPAFRADPGNLMILPPIPYGPDETIGPDDVDLPPEVTAELAPVPRLATLDVRADLTVARAIAGDLFFGQPDRELADRPLAEVWRDLPPALGAALQTRFANQPAPAADLPVTLAGRPVRVQLAEFAPEATPRRKFRLSLAETISAGDLWRVVFGPGARVRGGQRQRWEQLSAAARETVAERVRRRFAGAVPAEELVLDGQNVLVTVKKADFALPLRPVPGHWLGLDQAGHDVLVWVVYAFRLSMLFGILLVLISKVVGVVIGALQGYYGGLLDLSVQRFTEVWSALPFLYIMIFLGAIYGRSFALLLGVYAVFNWIGISYYLRAEFLRLRQQPFVEAARVTGLPAHRIMFRHIFPNALTPLITFVPFSLVGAIGLLSALDYLGFGLPPLTPSWGTLLNDAQKNSHAWWLTLYPALALFGTMLMGVFIGEGVRAAFDPKKFQHLE